MESQLVTVFNLMLFYFVNFCKEIIGSPVKLHKRETVAEERFKEQGVGGGGGGGGGGVENIKFRFAPELPSIRTNQ